ncbi:MAG: hypothetical protein VKN33_06810 [Candidatus Sericytochromatia bacterium]|nr:hypothetical protein [Candidatus Sericytochromatia bacterium]
MPWSHIIFPSLLGFALVLAPCLPVSALPAVGPIWTRVPLYPGATRPLPQWEAPRLAIAQTADTPLQVVAYYATELPLQGWEPLAQTVPEAAAAIAAGAPAWLSFTHPHEGRLDLQIHSGRHPKTGRNVTMIFYETIQYKD